LAAAGTSTEIGGQMHAHEHGSSHQHDHSHPRYADQPHPQHVVLDIGGEIGALIVHTDPDLLGTEVEISRAGEDDRRNHKEVLERTTGGGSEHVLVFDNLLEGAYTLWVAGVAKAREVRVEGAEIAELDWRSAPTPSAASS
jgi:hypothetical protein